MVRAFLLSLCLLAGLGLGAQDLGRTERFWREYLSETVRRGLPLGSSEAPQSVPYWPSLDRFRSEAQILEPSDDVVLLAAWVDLAEGGSPPTDQLQRSWPQPVLHRFSPRQWGETLFASWDPHSQPREWTDAWLSWVDKVYSPVALTRGLLTLEVLDPSAVLPLARQALALYPYDRRFLPFVLRHPELVPNPEALLARDRAAGGWSSATLARLLSRDPQSRPLLERAGYSTVALEDVMARDYGVWLGLAPDKNPSPGGWKWDWDQDGVAETDLVFQDGLASWSRQTSEGRWTLSFQAGLPGWLRETHGGSTWTLSWESYPWASALEYRWGDQRLMYRFPPLAQSVPLWPEARFQAPLRLPAALATHWLPLDPQALASKAATVETWKGDKKVQTVFLHQGEVWLQVEDTDRDGIDDTWSYFRSGRLASVYHSVGGRGQAGLRELYLKGELIQVQSKADKPRNEMVLFPIQGVQLWDPHGDRRPLERVFLWSGGDKLGAFVFTKDKLPWETMPAWEPRP